MKTLQIKRTAALLAAIAFAGTDARATDFNVASGAFVDGSSWLGGNPPGTFDDANINNGGTATFGAFDFLDISRLHLGVGGGDKGTLIMNGGTLNITEFGGNGDDTAVTIGDLGVGTFTMNGGQIDLGGLINDDGDFHIGKSGTGSTMTMNDGLVRMGGTLRIARGQAGNATGTLSILGGEFDTGEGVVVARGNAGSSPVATFIIGGKGTYIAGNSRGEGNFAGYSGEGFFSISNSVNTTGHVTIKDTGLVKARRLTGRQGTGDLTIQDDARFYVVNDLGAATGGALYGSYLGGGSASNGDGSDGTTGNYTLTLKGNGLLDIDANAALRDVTRPDLQGFQFARGNSKATANISDKATFIVRQRLIIGGLGANVDLNGFDGKAGAGTNPGGTAAVIMTGGTLSADQLIVGGSGNGTLSVSGGSAGTKAYAATYDPTLFSANTSVDSIRIGMLQTAVGVMNVSGAAHISTGADLGIGQYGNGTLKVTGGAASIQANDVYVQKFAGSKGTVIAEITGATHTSINANNNVTINGGTFQVLPTAVPTTGAHTWKILTADTDADGNGVLTGKFNTLTLPAPDALQRYWSTYYGDKDFLVGLTISGDANYDGEVGFPDLVAVAQHYGASGQWMDGDFSGDGEISFPDLVDVAQHYGTSLPSSPIPGAQADFNHDLARAFASVPEPSSISVIGLAIVTLARRRRKA
jgi:hypothetical protein